MKGLPHYIISSRVRPIRADDSPPIGIKFTNTSSHRVPIHISEMQAPVGPYIVQLTLLAPVDRARDGIAAVHTVLSSWRWLA